MTHGTLMGYDVLILITEWKEPRGLDFERMMECLKTPVIFDGRNQYNAEEMRELGIEYHQTGVGEKRWSGKSN